MRGCRVMAALMIGAACAPPQVAPRITVRPDSEAAASPVATIQPADVAGAIARASQESQVPAAVRAFYARRAYAPVFVLAEPASENADAAIAALDALPNDGIPVPPALARARALRACVANADSAAALDLLLTGLWLDAARALSGHRIDPARVDSSWGQVPEPIDAVGALAAAAESGGAVTRLAGFAPPDPGYDRLRVALRRYRAIAASGGWPVELPARLAAEGDWRPGDSLDAAVRRFQQRHGLTPDGLVGSVTQAELAVPVEQRVRQLEANLERWRWLPRRLGVPSVMVNIPAFELRLVDADTVLTRRVILGRLDWETPLLTSAITRLVVAPPWGVPREIARQEVIPAIRADTGYIARHAMLVYPEHGAATPVDAASVDWTAPDSAFAYRLVQLPGPSNPLGRVKFVFENAFGVYLHDTPATDLFREPARAMSHGCVRVEGALDLATRLLRGSPTWSPQRLATAVAAGSTRTVALPWPVPIYLTYFTAWVDATGALQFRGDLYGWDARLTASIPSPAP